MFIIVSCCLVSINGSKYLLKKPGCTAADQRRIDDLAATFFTFGPKARLLPTSYQELKPFCKELKSTIKKIEAFMNRCYSQQVLQFGRIIFYTFNKQFRTFCTKRTKKITHLMKMTPCYNKHLRTETLCVENWLKDFSILPKLYHDKDKVIHGCW